MTMLQYGRAGGPSFLTIPFSSFCSSFNNNIYLVPPCKLSFHATNHATSINPSSMSLPLLPPLAVLCGVYLALTQPAMPLMTSNPLMQPIFVRLACLLTFFAWSQAVVLYVTTNVKVWKRCYLDQPCVIYRTLVGCELF